MYRDKERYGLDPSQVIQVKQKTINEVLRKAKPGDKIFTCSWSDFFIEEADQWRPAAWDIIRSRPDLIWQILTKREDRILQCLPPDWGDGWNNVWLGVSVENDEFARKRIPTLLSVPAKVRFLSCEPLIGPVDLFSFWLDKFLDNTRKFEIGTIDWVIIGGESGNENGKYRYRKCEVEWIQSIAGHCQSMGVPVFVKQLGTHIAQKLQLGSDRHGNDINNFPESLKIRQFPYVR